jgi:multisubunit Na+/H+ antiporter MnhB subunit
LQLLHHQSGCKGFTSATTPLHGKSFGFSFHCTGGYNSGWSRVTAREMGALLSGGVIPLLNILVAVKVALGSWAVILVFIRYRGLL